MTSCCFRWTSVIQILTSFSEHAHNKFCKSHTIFIHNASLNCSGVKALGYVKHSLFSSAWALTSSVAFVSSSRFTTWLYVLYTPLLATLIDDLGLNYNLCISAAAATPFSKCDRGLIANSFVNGIIVVWNFGSWQTADEQHGIDKHRPALTSYLPAAVLFTSENIFPLVHCKFESCPTNCKNYNPKLFDIGRLWNGIPLVHCSCLRWACDWKGFMTSLLNSSSKCSFLVVSRHPDPHANHWLYCITLDFYAICIPFGVILIAFSTSIALDRHFHADKAPFIYSKNRI